MSLAGLQRILQPISAGVSPGPVLATAGATLGLAVALRVWSVEGLSSYAVVISIVAGSLIGIGSGLTAPETLAAIGRAPILALPNLTPFGLAFDASIALPFVVSALASAIGAIGDATNAQKINNEAWVRPGYGLDPRRDHRRRPWDDRDGPPGEFDPCDQFGRRGSDPGHWQRQPLRGAGHISGAGGGGAEFRSW